MELATRREVSSSDSERASSALCEICSTRISWLRSVILFSSPGRLERARSCRGEFAIASRPIGNEEKFVELGRFYPAARKHGGCLPAMMNLMHEEMGQDRRHDLPVHALGTAIEDDGALEFRSVKRAAQCREPEVESALRGTELRHGRVQDRVGETE